MTLRTDERALQLALEEINNNTIVTLLVSLPALLAELSKLAIASAGLPVGFLDVRLLLDPVEILVKAVEEESDELLGVMLAVTCELRGEAGRVPLQLARRERRVGGGRCPQSFDRTSESFGDLTLHSERVVGVELGAIYAG